MANPFSKLKQDLLAEELMKQEVQPEMPPVSPEMLQQQLAPQIDVQEQAMLEAPQVAAGDSFFSGIAGGHLAPKETPEQIRKAKEFSTRQKGRDSINQYFAPSEPESELFKMIKEKLKGGTFKK